MMPSARLREAEAQLSVAQAAISASEEQVQIAAAGKERFDTMLTYLRITAPFAGTITKRLADPGAMIQAGTASHVQAMPVVQLSQVDHLRLVLPVPESVVPRIRTDTPVEVRVESLKRVFQGRISRFSGKLDSSTRTMETEVDLPNPDSVIKPGMFGYATLGARAAAWTRSPFRCRRCRDDPLRRRCWSWARTSAWKSDR